MRTLLIDDEPHNCELLETLLGRHCAAAVEVVGHAHSVDSAVVFLQHNPVDLVFLDVQMPGKNGFQLFEKIQSPHFETIFVTSFDQYALPAFKTDAVAYLLKPVVIDDLKKAVEKAAKMHVYKHLEFEEIQGIATAQTAKIAVHEGDKVIYLNLVDLVSCEAEGRYSKLAMKNGETYMIAKHLKLIEEEFGSSSRLMRISRSVLINRAYILEYTKSEPFFVVLSDGSRFEISRRKRQEIIRELRTKIG